MSNLSSDSLFLRDLERVVQNCLDGWFNCRSNQGDGILQEEREESRIIREDLRGLLGLRPQRRCLSLRDIPPPVRGFLIIKLHSPLLRGS